jgi:hypothetical protein
MIHESFVYKWKNVSNEMFYIGKHKGTDDDGYVSSGRAFLAHYNSDPTLFKREILFRGTDAQCLRYEQERIDEAVATVGWQGIYNITSWKHLSEWKQTCLKCGAVCYPKLAEWAEKFEDEHFLNCRRMEPRSQPIITQKIDRVSKKKLSRRQEREQWWRARIRRLGAKDAMNIRIL